MFHLGGPQSTVTAKGCAMNNPTRMVLVLAGRLGEPEQPGSISAILERLARRSISAQVLCAAREPASPADGRIFEMPRLGSRWRRTFAARRLRFDEGLKRPELLHVISTELASVGLAIADHWRIPYLLTVDEFLPPGGRIGVSRRWCRGFSAPSDALAADLTRALAVPADFLTVIRPGIAIPEESSATTRRGVVPVIGTAGPLVPSAGLVAFLSAARRVLDAGIDAEFVIAGQGESEFDLRRRAERLRIADRTTFAGRNVIGLRFWRALDVFCQTSLCPTVGRTLALAMAYGVPAVATDLEGLRALVAHGVTGLRIPPGDSGALAQTILELLADPARTRRLGQAGREAIRHNFDPEGEADQLTALYRRALAGTAAAVVERVPA
jgi:glycosyltransferase involved in cell wall biosynthesis